MKRREFLGVLGGAAGWPLAARAQQSTTPVLGFVAISGREAIFNSIWYPAFLESLSNHGWVPGRNLSIEYRFADNNPLQLRAVVEDLIRLKPDVIYVPTRPALSAVKDATTTIPIVFVSLGDPLAEGWISSLARPAGNLTGVAGLSPELAGKRLEILRELIPSLTKVAVLRDPANRPEDVAIQATELAAQKLGISVTVVSVSTPSELDHSIARLAKNGTESIIVSPAPMFNEHRKEIVEKIAQLRMPAIYMETGFVSDGGLISYGPNLVELIRRSAGYVDKILRGAKAADLPVEQPTKFELVLNLKTANALGLAMPTSILLRATDIIE